MYHESNETRTPLLTLILLDVHPSRQRPAELGAAGSNGPAPGRTDADAQVKSSAVACCCRAISSSPNRTNTNLTSPVLTNLTNKTVGDVALQ